MSTTPAIIDVHHHVLPPFYVEALSSRGASRSGGRSVYEPALKWSLEGTLGFLDRHGITAALASFPDPGVSVGGPAFARELARRCNDFLASLASDHPGRFGGFAVLPLPDVDDALRELEHALDTLELDGVSLLTSYGGRYLGDPGYDPLFAELERRRAVALVHPSYPPDRRPNPPLAPWVLEFPFETTRAMVNLLYGGTLERCPGVRLVLAHAGGATPYLAHRIGLGQRDARPTPSEPAAAALSRCSYDTALSAGATTFASLVALAGPAHMHFGSDFPFADDASTAQGREAVEQFAGFGDEGREAVLGGAARALFPRLAARMAGAVVRRRETAEVAAD
jgi:predicted TIM-barrel fold metal-dependent hydrolase